MAFITKTKINGVNYFYLMERIKKLNGKWTNKIIEKYGTQYPYRYKPKIIKGFDVWEGLINQAINH